MYNIKKCLKKKKKNYKIRDIKIFLEKNVYEDISKYKKKTKKKIKQEDFVVPTFDEYKNIVKLNYNVKQLKEICKHYKLTKSGSKPQLKFKVFNYLKYSYNSLKIQKKFREYLIRKINKLKGPSLINRKCTNETDFLMFENVKEISYEQFFSYKDVDGFVYGFNICSLFNLLFVEKNKGEPRNPYNRNKINEKTINNIKKLIMLSKTIKLNTEIIVENDLDLLSFKKKVELKCIDIFQKFDELGHYTQYTWFYELDKRKLLKFINELRDVWGYRLNLSPEIKKDVCPPLGKPFQMLNIQNLFSQDIDKIKNGILNIINNFVTLGRTRNDKGLGAYYVLGSLTLVSQSAAIALPWLYETFIY